MLTGSWYRYSNSGSDGMNEAKAKLSVSGFEAQAISGAEVT